ncbi:MAG TPA: hypothetical protein VME66_12045 [Candidatus Acidoferrales bacterium]|nr:hypothetical protein [Candidatus Acidoferrales bacterium]
MRQRLAFLEKMVSGRIAREDRALDRIDDEDGVGSRGQIRLDLVVDIGLMVIGRTHFEGGVRWDERCFESIIACAAHALVRKKGNVGCERPNLVPGRRDTESPLRADFAPAPAPRQQSVHELALEQGVPALRVHSLDCPSRDPLQAEEGPEQVPHLLGVGCA